MIFGGSENVAKNDVILFDLTKNVFRRIKGSFHRANEDLDENTPAPRDFHSSVFDPTTSSMYIFGGNEKHGKVNYVH